MRSEIRKKKATKAPAKAMTLASIERRESEARVEHRLFEAETGLLYLDYLVRVVLTPTALEHSSPQEAELYKRLINLHLGKGTYRVSPEKIAPIHAELRSYIAWTLWYHGMAKPRELHVLNVLAAILDTQNAPARQGWPVIQNSAVPVNPPGAETPRPGTWKGHRYW